MVTEKREREKLYLGVASARTGSLLWARTRVCARERRGKRGKEEKVIMPGGPNVQYATEMEGILQPDPVSRGMLQN